MKRSVTIVDIAKHAGVSFKTVSRVLNGAPTVAAELRDRVEQAIRDLDYKPNRAASLLRGGKSHALGLIIGSHTEILHASEPDHHMPSYAADVILGLLQACHAAEHHLVIENISSVDARMSGEMLRRFLDLVKLDGVILVPPLCDIAWVLDLLDNAAIPFARINPGLDLDRGLCFVIDNNKAAHDVGEAILEMGHRRIGFIDGPESHTAQRERKIGFLDIIGSVAGASVEVRQGNFLFASGFEMGHELLALPERPTAIFAANDEMAAGVLAAAIERGIDVPGQLSLVGFGGLAVSTHTWPRIATVRQSTIEIARLAGNSLIERDTRDGVAWDRVVTMPYELVTRQSMAPAVR